MAYPAMNIYEILDSKLPYTLVSSSDSKSVYRFRTQSQSIDVSFTKSAKLHSNEVIDYTATDDMSQSIAKLSKYGSVYELLFNVTGRDGDFDLTGTGRDQFYIFSTVIAIAQEFLSKHRVLELFSIAEGDKRIRVYDKMYPRIPTDVVTRVKTTYMCEEPSFESGVYVLINNRLLKDMRSVSSIRRVARTIKPTKSSR